MEKECKDCWHNYHCPMPQEGYDFNPDKCPYNPDNKKVVSRLKVAAEDSARKKYPDKIYKFHKVGDPDGVYNGESAMSMDHMRKPYREGFEDGVRWLADIINRHIDANTFNAHEMPDSDSRKKFLEGSDTALCGIIEILNKI